MMTPIRSRPLRNLEEVVKESISDIQAAAAPRQERVARRPFVEMTENDFKEIGKYSIVKTSGGQYGYTTSHVPKVVAAGEGEPAKLQVRIITFGADNGSYEDLERWTIVEGAVWGVLTGESGRGARADSIYVRMPDGGRGAQLIFSAPEADAANVNKVNLQYGNGKPEAVDVERALELAGLAWERVADGACLLTAHVC